MDFRKYLEEIASIYRGHGAELIMSPPASPEAPEPLETAVGQPLEPGLRAAWLASEALMGDLPVFGRDDSLESYALMTPREAIEQRADMKARSLHYEGPPPDLDERIFPGWFQGGWVPFGGFGGGALLLISDMSPAPGGKPGQIIAYIHDPDELIYVADSFDAFLRRSLQAFEEEAEELLIEVLCA